MGKLSPGQFLIHLTFSHLRQILHVHMQVAGLIGLARLVLGAWRFRLQVAQVAHPMPSQTPVEAGARHLRVQKLPDHRQQIVDRHQKRLARHDRHRLLRRGQRGLQPVRDVAAVMDRVAVPPFVDGLLGRAEPRRQGKRRLRAGLDRRPNPLGRRRLAVKMDQHARTPL